MYFIVDLVLILLLLCIVFTSIKYGFSRNFVFGLIRTIIGMAGGVALCAGAFILMNKFGWLDIMADAVVGFFGNPAWLQASNPKNLRIVARVVAFLPFALILLILGYIILHKLINFLVKGIFLPFFVARKKVSLVRGIDIAIGLIFNLGLYIGFVLVLFGFIHGINTVQTSDGDYVYDDVSIILFGENDDEDALTDFLANTVDNATGPMLNKWHESLNASPTGRFIYQYNPLNGVFENIVKNLYNI